MSDSVSAAAAEPSSGGAAAKRHLALGGRMVAAWIALVALALVVVRLLFLVIADVVETVGFLLSLALFALGVWWVITGRRTKRHVGFLLASLAGLAAIAAIVGFAIHRPRSVVALFGFLFVFGFFSARALALPSRLDRWRENRVTLPADAHRPSMPLGRVAVPAALIVNEWSGGGKAEQIDLAHRARQMGVQVKVLRKGDDLIELAETLVHDGAEVVGMAGGDGSLGLVASVAMAHDIPFVCIPVGTRNHFARDLGLDRSDPLAALTAFRGREVRVDVGVINDRTFLNNGSFGVYADMVHDPGYRDAKLETGQNLVSQVLAGERPPSPLHFEGPDGTAFDSAFLILVAVGSYEMSTITDLGVRSSMTSGELQITVLEPADERNLRRLTTAAVLGTLEGQDGFWQWTATTFRVASPEGVVHVGLDGEALTFDSPAEITLRPGALRVLVPEEIEPVPGPKSQPLSATITDLWKLAVGTDV